MNNDLISREELKKAIEKYRPKSTVKSLFLDGLNCMFMNCISVIDNAPTVENITVFCENADEKTIEELKAEMQKAKLAVFEERPQGEWIIVTDKYGKNVKCPFCGKEIAGTDLNFCCKCGAKLIGSEKMKGGAE